MYLVEVRSVPLTLLDRILSGLGADRTDTIPGLRVDVLPAVVDDSVILGLWTNGEQGRPAGTFTYDPHTRLVSRAPLPVWLQDFAQYSQPAFSRDARYLAYVAVTPEGHQQALVRQWPDGNIVLRGPSGEGWNHRDRGRAAWIGEEVLVSYDASVGGKPVMFSFFGSPHDRRTTRLDTFPWHPSMGVKLLSPRAFPLMAEAVRDSLVARRCLVPQAESSGDPRDLHNVITGNLAARGQTDWAALCSRADSSSIVVIWGGPARCASELGREQNRTFREGYDSRRYRRVIDVVDSVTSGLVYASWSTGAAPRTVLESSTRRGTSNS
jgi:hypothetical protein